MAEDRSVEEQVVALTELLQSTGWKMLLEYADEQAGPLGYSRQVQHAVATIPTGPDRAYELQRAVEQIQAVAAAVTQLTNWPKERLQALVPVKKSSGPFDALRRSTR